MPTDLTQFHFLLSSERSGSNLLCKLLDAHPDVSSPAPLHALRFFLPLIDKGAAIDGDTFRLFFNNKLGLWHTEFPACPEKKANFWKHWKLVYRKEAELEHKQHIFIKENRFHEIADPVLKRYPDSKLVYLIRNPFSYAVSFLKSPNHHGDLAHAINLWMEDQNHFFKLKNELGERCLCITYESLLTETEKTLKKICTHLGIKYSGFMLNFYKKPINQENAKRISNWENISKPLKHLGNIVEIPLSEMDFEYVKNTTSAYLRTVFEQDFLFERTDETIEKRCFSKGEQHIREQRAEVIENIKYSIFQE